MPFDKIGQCPYCGECNTMNHSCSGRIDAVKNMAQLLGLNKCDDEEGILMPFDNIGECNTMNHSCSGRIYDDKNIAQLLGLKFGPNKCDDEENLKKLIHDMATSMENMVVWGQWINRKRSPRMDEPNSGAILECIEMLNKYKKYVEEGKI